MLLPRFTVCSTLKSYNDPNLSIPKMETVEPTLITLLTLKELPNAVLSKTLNVSPNLAMVLKLKAEPMQTFSNTDISLLNLPFPVTDKPLPNRAVLLIDNDEANWKKLNTLIADPAREKLLTDTEEDA
jgi:hypothetical protein